MPSEISIPFRLGSTSRLATETIPDAQIRQHVMSLINTSPGERVVLGNYGIPLADSVFDGPADVVAQDLAVDISDAMQEFEPGVAIKDISPVEEPSGSGMAKVDVEYYRTDSSATSSVLSRSQNFAAISASGKVSETIR